MDSANSPSFRQMMQKGTVPLRCWAEIDLAALERNLKKIQDNLPDHIRYIAVVKADAYGHGMQQTVARMMQAGVDMFAVANITEAITIREIGGAGWSILVLSAVLPDEIPYLFEYDLIPTLSSCQEIEALQNAASRMQKSLKVHIKVDTGMGRLGVWHENAQEVFDALDEARDLTLDGVFTHFAHADGDIAFTDLQRERFLTSIATLEDRYPDLLIHADNSAGIGSFGVVGPYNAVRIGILQFGVSPYEKSLFQGLETEPVLSFKTRVSLVKNLPKGTTISYGRSVELRRDSTVAVLSAGYGDGIPRSLSNKGFVLLNGCECPFLGRVTMDQIIVDVTDMPRSPNIGEDVCLIGTQAGQNIYVEVFSGWANTIPWEILCSITKRVTRIYKTHRHTA